MTMEPLEAISRNVNESLGLVRYLLLWGMAVVGLGSLALIAWSRERGRTAIVGASLGMRTSSWHVLVGFAAYAALAVPVVVLLHAAPLLGIAALALVLVHVIAPAVAAASLELGGRLTGEDGSLRALLVGLALLSGTGFVFVIGLLPWLWWVLAATGALARSCATAVAARITPPAPAGS